MEILIAEDDALSNLKTTLTIENWGHDVVRTFDGDAAWDQIQRLDTIALAIIDIMMPGIDGVELCRRTRALDRMVQPYLILLTAKTGKDDVVRGLDAGANDYITKPFDVDELRARVGVGLQMVELQRALSERVQQLEEALGRANQLQGLLRGDNNVYSFGPFVLDAAERRLKRNGELLTLSTKVFDLLLLFVQNSGHLLEKSQLMAQLWPNSFVEENNLTVNMSILRKILGKGTDDSSYIETVPTRGYRFVAPVRVATGKDQ